MTAALTERNQLEDDLDPSEYDLDDLDDEDDDAPPLRRHVIDRTKQQRLRLAITTQRTATQAALLELVSAALAAKVAHDVDAHPIALEALDTFTATAAALRAAITTEQQTIQEAEDNHQ